MLALRIDVEVLCPPSRGDLLQRSLQSDQIAPADPANNATHKWCCVSEQTMASNVGNMGTAIPADIDLMILGHYKYGEGSVPVLVLHEWLAAHHNYLPMLSYVDAGRFTYLFADLRGYGLSGNFLGDFSAAEAAADVLRLADALGFESFCLVGHSMSGMIAQRVAADAPDRVNRLLLISPVPASGFKTDEAGFRSMAAIVENRAAAAAAVGARTGYRYGSAWVARKLDLMAAGGQSEPMMGYLRMFTGTDFADEVAGLQTPVSVLVGEHDIEAYREATIVKNFGPLFPNLSVQVSREAGHYMMLETPVWAASRIEQFLEAA